MSKVVKFSPYNSPFVPHNSGDADIWVGLEHKGAICDSHVIAYFDQPAQKQAHRNQYRESIQRMDRLTRSRSMSDERYCFLVDLYDSTGIVAAGRAIGAHD